MTTLAGKPALPLPATIASATTSPGTPPTICGHSRTTSLLLTLAGSAGARHSLISVARDLARLPGGAIVPASVSELSAAVGEVPGVHLGLRPRSHIVRVLR